MADATATNQNSGTETTTATTLLTDKGAATDTAKTGGDGKTGAEGSNNNQSQTQADGTKQTATDAKTDDKGAEGKGKEEAPKPKAPEKYEPFALPEGMKLDEAASTEFTTLAKELDLTQEQAQKAVTLQTAIMQRYQKEQTEAYAKQISDWGDSAKTDKEYGGDKFDASITSARLALSKFGSPELRQLLEGGIGNHPEVIRFMVRVGQAMGEDTLHNAQSSGTTKSAEEVLYGGTK